MSAHKSIRLLFAFVLKCIKYYGETREESAVHSSLNVYFDVFFHSCCTVSIFIFQKFWIFIIYVYYTQL